ncbi:ABC transporter ATP-binding protein [Schaedlerella arabinosiphila]|uniref:ABC transporter ATP-binding protein n=1 Tax=Schaedlerella arabinosiphila TaxID=2044587 RepID=A0A9X5C933_9FIRM|nr:ABC transporter ATP-binding protein [Schaedlerella arabinosiphila]NDO68883.1 ABC transporter ATP-binding protein [Schaedlerella arabinosiphila]
MGKLEIRDLNFSYTENEEILKGINLVLEGESTAIIGQNGAGKTTFVKLLKGLLRPTSGNILYNGTDLNTLTVAQIARNIGMVFQNPNDQIFKNTVIDEVMFGPLKIGMSKEQAGKHSEEVLDMVGLLKLKNVNPYDLGLSERKLVSIAAILAMNPDVIIFDEPTIAQDYAGKTCIGNIVKKLRNEGRLVLTIIHDMDFVAEYFERAVVFAKGNVLLEGKPEKVFAEADVLEKAYLEQPNVTRLCYALGQEKIFLTTDAYVEYMRG